MNPFERPKCCVCGKKLGLNRFGLGPHQEDWVCASCLDDAGGKQLIDFRKMSGAEIRSFAMHRGAFIEHLPEPAVADFEPTESVRCDYKDFEFDEAHQAFRLSSFLCAGESVALPVSDFDRMEVTFGLDTIASRPGYSLLEAVNQEFLSPQDHPEPGGNFKYAPRLNITVMKIYLKDQEKPAIKIQANQRPLNFGTQVADEAVGQIRKACQIVDRIQACQTLEAAS